MNELLEPPGSVPLLPYQKKVAIVCNLRPEGLECQGDVFEEYDSYATVESLAQELESLGFEPVFIEQNHNFLQTISANRPDFVFNLAEGLGSFRGRESQVPSILESLGIPFTGSDSVSLAISLDKLLTHRNLSAGGIPVPTMRCFKAEADLMRLDEIFQEHSSWMVKPRWEGSSKGVFNDSLSSSPDDMAEKIRRIWSMYGQPALAESFLPGDEYTVGVVGNGFPRVIGMMRISCPSQEDGPFIYSLENKRAWEGRILYQGPETMESDLRSTLEGAALKAFSVLELRDVSRIDFRLDETGTPRVIDVNPLPGMSPSYSDLPILCRLSGSSYGDLVRVILEESMSRNGMYMPEAQRCAVSSL